MNVLSLTDPVGGTLQIIELPIDADHFQIIQDCAKDALKEGHKRLLDVISESSQSDTAGSCEPRFLNVYPQNKFSVQMLKQISFSTSFGGRLSLSRTARKDGPIDLTLSL
jgi:hypothetical protein